jgi:hypothetical protein
MPRRNPLTHATSAATIALCGTLLLAGCASAGTMRIHQAAAPAPATTLPAGFARACHASTDAEPSPSPPASAYLGLTIQQAQARATAHDQVILIVGHDHKCLAAVPADYNTHRVELYLAKGMVSDASLG